jgi:hypothetical protein
MGGAKRYPSIAVCDADGLRKGLDRFHVFEPRVNVRNHEPFASRNADSNAVKNIVHIMMATMASRSSAIFQM